MIAMGKSTDLITVVDVANDLGLTASRVGQIARTLRVGTIVGNIRILTRDEAEEIKAFPRVMGRPKKTQNQT